MTRAWQAEDLSADVDGAEDTFTLSNPFRLGSVIPRINGDYHADETTELPPNQFQLNPAPKVGDTLIVHFTRL